MASMQTFRWFRHADKCPTVGISLLRQVGVLVNNAGMLMNRYDQDCWDAIMAVNYTGAISLAEQILPVLAEGAPARSRLCVI